MDDEKNLGPLRLLRRVLAARRGDVRAKVDLYHLRGVLTFVAIFAATIVLPGLLLAYYGVAGIRAQQRAGAAEVERVASGAGDNFQVGVDSLFKGFEDNTLNRLKSGQSVTSGLREISESLRVVFRYDAEGALRFPRSPDSEDALDDQELFFFAPWQAALRSERLHEFGRAAFFFGQAAREARAPDVKGQAIYARANAAHRAGEIFLAEQLYTEVLTGYAAVRDAYGFRLGDLARLKLGELRLGRDPVAGEAAVREHVDELLAEPWIIGRGGEAAVARRGIDLIAGRANAEWLGRARGRLEDRASQLFWAERLLPELETLGAKGRMLRVAPGEFSYSRTEHALWATTWTDEDQYVLGLDLEAVMAQLREIAQRSTSPQGDVIAVVRGPDDPEREPPLARRSLAPWFPNWSLGVYPRDAADLLRRQGEERQRGIGIILLSVAMITVGTVLSARLVQRELEVARDKSDFAANVSHELRSPITQIRLKAEALQLGLAPDAASRERHYDVIVREAERLSRLVDNVLDFAAIERGRKKYTFRPGDLGLSVARMVEAAMVAMETRGMDIQLTLPEDLPVVWHDTDAVSQVLTNLLSNAAKYGQESGWIKVDVALSGEEVLVAISDGGIGIAPEEQRQIFEQYYRSSDPLARRKKGTGIGLTIVKYIMEAHGGRVSVRSAPGSGSTFTLHFPLRPPGLNA
ncbi:MAG: HAMP domain-containing sensor histidine kinase [Pseudomonadota bacterium]|nr:HAMP domain-containing sensor histidine kinase [Pseudomonadota bacterium]